MATRTDVEPGVEQFIACIPDMVRLMREDAPTGSPEHIRPAEAAEQPKLGKRTASFAMPRRQQNARQQLRFASPC